MSDAAFLDVVGELEEGSATAGSAASSSLRELAFAQGKITSVGLRAIAAVCPELQARAAGGRGEGAAAKGGRGCFGRLCCLGRRGCLVGVVESFPGVEGVG